MLQPGVKLTLLAEHPDLVTPTGIDVDDEGQHLAGVVATRTSGREGYAGPAHDEILVFDKDGKNRRVFYNKTDATMHVEIGPDGWIYLAERDRILRVKDTDGDGIGDVEENLATLDTRRRLPAQRPLRHGVASRWRPRLFARRKLRQGLDAHVARWREAQRARRGRRLPLHRRWQRAAPHRPRVLESVRPAACATTARSSPWKTIPGSRPPCRLLNIVEGADYGFQWVYGSAPVHPFVAWNGELRGTLGMVHPSGEGAVRARANSAAACMVPSWSNHRIDYFPLTRKGAGYTSQRIAAAAAAAISSAPRASRRDRMARST